MKTNNIEGWLLNNPDEEIFDLLETGKYAGSCMSEGTCMHYSHDPYGPVYVLYLKNNMMEFLHTTLIAATNHRDPQTEVDYFRLPDARLLRVIRPYHYGAHAEIVDQILPGEEKSKKQLEEEWDAEYQRLKLEDRKERLVPGIEVRVIDSASRFYHQTGMLLRVDGDVNLPYRVQFPGYTDSFAYTLYDLVPVEKQEPRPDFTRAPRPRGERPKNRIRRA